MDPVAYRVQKKRKRGPKDEVLFLPVYSLDRVRDRHTPYRSTNSLHNGARLKGHRSRLLVAEYPVLHRNMSLTSTGRQ